MKTTIVPLIINGTIEDVCNDTDPVYSGDYNPENSLSAFIGMERAGDWVLTVSDATVPDEGVLNTWCLNITSEVCPPDLAGANALSGMVNGTETFASSGDLESTQSIETGADVIYTTPGTISLDFPFEVKIMADFTTEDDGCNN